MKGPLSILKIVFAIFGFIQIVFLFISYSQLGTYRKTSELLTSGDLYTPLIVACAEPANFDDDHHILSASDINHKEGPPTFSRTKTLWKGNCDIIESKKTKINWFWLCYNSSSSVVLYTLSYGELVFLKTYHPIKTLDHTTLTGRKVYNVRTVPKAVISLFDCEPLGSGLEAIIDGLKKYEQCLLQELKEKAKTLNVSTHPIFQNFSSNKSQVTKNEVFPEFILTAEIENAHKTCKKPCVDISYNARIEQYSIPPHLDQTNLSGCGEGLGSIRYDFNRVWKLETEQYILSSVDLLSSIGGALGLWLGWSVLTVGEYLIYLYNTLRK